MSEQKPNQTTTQTTTQTPAPAQSSNSSARPTHTIPSSSGGQIITNSYGGRPQNPNRVDERKKK